MVHKSKIIKTIQVSTFVLLLFLLPSLSIAQTSIGGGGPPNPGDNSGGGDTGAGFDDDTEDQIVPIDGLVVIGMIAGSIYGIRRKYKN